MSLDADLIQLIDQRVRAAQASNRSAGTCVSRAAAGPTADVVFDGSTVAMPVKVLGNVFVQPGDRVVMDRYGSDWVVTGSWSALAFGEASRAQLGPAGGTAQITSGTFLDIPDLTSVTFDKSFDATYVRIGMQVGAFCGTAGTGVRFGARFTPRDAGSSYPATDINMTTIFFNAALDHQANSSMFRVTDIPAGTYTVSWRWRRNAGTGFIQADSADQFALEVDEAVRAAVPVL